MSNQITLSPSSGQSYRTPDVVLPIASGQSYRTPDVVLSPASRQYIAPADPTLYVYPPGFVGAVFGAGQATFETQYLTGLGFNGSLFGTGNVYNLTQYVTGTGFVDSRYGPGLVYNLTQYLAGAGFVDSHYGTGRAYNETQKLYGSGFLGSLFGSSRLTHTRITSVGEVQTRFGQGWVSNSTRFLYGFHPKTYQFLYGTWLYAPSPDEFFGAGTATHTRITSVGEVQTRFGQGKVQPLVQYIQGYGFYDRLFGNNGRVELQHRQIQGQGFIGTIFGDAVQNLYGQGSIHSLFGYGGVTGMQIAGGSLGVATRFGQGSVSRTPQYLYGTGIAPSNLFGNPPYGVMHTFEQSMHGTGEVFSQFERDDWDYRVGGYMFEVDFLHVPGVAGAQFGTGSVARA